MSKRNMHEWVQEILNSRKRMAFPLMPYIGLALTGKKVLGRGKGRTESGRMR